MNIFASEAVSFRPLITRNDDEIICSEGSKTLRFLWHTDTVTVMCLSISSARRASLLPPFRHLIILTLERLAILIQLENLAATSFSFLNYLSSIPLIFTVGLILLNRLAYLLSTV